MIAIGILTTWLTLTAAGFAGLSALSRAGARESVEADLMFSESWRFSDPSAALADARIPIPNARIPIPKALLQ